MNSSDPVSEGLNALSDVVSDIVDETCEQIRAEKIRLNKPVSYWGNWFPGLKHSPKQFYATVEAKVKEYALPNLELEPIVLRQGGPGSPSRLYLRSSRDKLVFEVCAAPFGNGFFVSSRLFDRRKEARWYHILLFLFLVSMPSGLAYLFLPEDVWSLVIFFGLLAFVWSLMRLAQAEVISWLTRKLPDMPLLGRIYERYFNPDTFFRQDTNACYRTAFHGAVMSAIDDMTSAHGLRPLSAEERKPMLGEPHLV